MWVLFLCLCYLAKELVFPHKNSGRQNFQSLATEDTADQALWDDTCQVTQMASVKVGLNPASSLGTVSFCVGPSFMVKKIEV